MRIVLGLCLALVLIAATPSESSAQAVAQIIVLEVTPAQMPDFLAAFARGGAIIQRLNPDSDTTLWQNTVGGAPNQLVIVGRFPSLEAWAAAQARNAASAEFQQIFAETLASGIKLISRTLQSQIGPPQ